jgi:hypothetical protein
VQLQEVHEKMDVGVLVQDNLKCAQQCAKVVGKANKVLGMIQRTLKNFSSDIVMKLYKCLIRPRLEFAVQAWRPHLPKDIDLIKGVQRRATKQVVGTKGMSYEERLKFLDMTTLETWRIRGNLIELFKILTGIEDVKEERFFIREKGCMRGHELKLFKPSCRLDCRKWAFSNRVIICHQMLLHIAQCIVSSTRLMLIWIVRGLYKSVMTFFPLPIGLPKILCPVVALICVDLHDILCSVWETMQHVLHFFWEDVG